MSIDLMVVCHEKPNFEVGHRLAGAFLGDRSGEAEISGLFVYEPAAGFHEFDGCHVVCLSAHHRLTPVYLGMLVVASALAVLFDGRVLDDVDFFPQVDPVEVLRRCATDEVISANELWDRLTSSAR